MSIDFLDRLEADLRNAAERRGQPSPRRRRPNARPALKALAVAAVLALLVVGGTRIANRDSTERPAGPTPTPTPTIEQIGGGPLKAAVATTGDPSSLEFFAQRLAKTAALEFVAPRDGRPALADPSLGTVVLYVDGAKRVAEIVARAAGIDRTRPLTEADRTKLSFNVRDAQVVIIFGPDLQERALQQSKDCTPGGHVTSGELSVCTVFKRGATISGLLVNGRRLPMDAMHVRGHWIWAAASPDGKAILAQWSGECEVPQTFLIDAARGKPRPVTGSGSEAYGWTTDGRAIVGRRADPGCSDGSAPGLYLATPDGEATLVGKAVPRSLQRTIAPRDVSQVIGGAAP